MVDVTDGADVDVWLGSLELLFQHDGFLQTSRGPIALGNPPN
jgi:hypothetical protein